MAPGIESSLYLSDFSRCNPTSIHFAYWALDVCSTQQFLFTTHISLAVHTALSTFTTLHLHRAAASNINLDYLHQKLSYIIYTYIWWTLYPRYMCISSLYTNIRWTLTRIGMFSVCFWSGISRVGGFHYAQMSRSLVLKE